MRARARARRAFVCVWMSSCRSSCSVRGVDVFCAHNCMCAYVHVCVVCAGDLRIAIHPCNFVHLIGNGSEFAMKCFCELQS